MLIYLFIIFYICFFIFFSLILCFELCLFDFIWGFSPWCDCKNSSRIFSPCLHLKMNSDLMWGTFSVWIIIITLTCWQIFHRFKVWLLAGTIYRILRSRMNTHIHISKIFFLFLIKNALFFNRNSRLSRRHVLFYFNNA